MIHKRFIIIGMIFLICLSVLLGRLSQIQLFETKSFTDRNINLIEESVKQRSQEMVIDNGRGKFYDRNMVPLTYEAVPSLILFPFLKKMEWDVEKVASIIGVRENEILQALEAAEEPIVFGKPEPIVLTETQMKAINQLKIPGVFAVKKQYDRKIPPAAQLIGLVGQNEKQISLRYPEKNIPKNTNIGISGLQKSFDEFLLQEENTKLIYHVDGHGGPLFGIDVKYTDPSNPFYPVNVQTTIDGEIQKKAEEIAERHKLKKGGLILLDIDTNSIIASVSRPEMNESNPYGNDGAKNYMLTAQIPGSVFKTVIAAAAIDAQLVPQNRTFDCSRTIHGEIDQQFQHGMIDFTKSFAVSCNNTFATLAKELNEIDKNMIETYAKKLGLTEEVGWQGDVYHFDDFKQLADEEKGQIFLSDAERKDSKLVAQTGIGQQNVRITPLQAANMMATIARGGEKKMVRAVSSIRYKNGTTLYQFPEKKLKGDTLAPYTISKLQQLLREVVVDEEGTGRYLKNLPYEVAGKSGTAQTYRFNENGQEYVNKWFVGYFPFDQPKYALAVVYLDALSTDGSVTPIFQDMVTYLFQLNGQ